MPASVFYTYADNSGIKNQSEVTNTCIHKNKLSGYYVMVSTLIRRRSLGLFDLSNNGNSGSGGGCGGGAGNDVIVIKIRSLKMSEKKYGDHLDIKDRK